MNILQLNYFGIPPTTEDPESPAWELYTEFMRNIGTQGRRLKNFDMIELADRLHQFRAAQFPIISEPQFQYTLQRIRVHRLFELTGRSYNDAGLFPEGFDFEGAYGPHEEPLLPSDILPGFDEETNDILIPNPL